MNLINLYAFVSDQIANGNAHRALAAAEAVAKAAGAVHGSDGDKAQAIADELTAALLPICPALDPVFAAVIAVGEKYIGKCVDAAEFKFAPAIAPLDAQNGAAIAPPA